MDSLLANISMVFQNVYLFDDTIENNIKFGKPYATHEEVVEATKWVYCDDFVKTLSDGYNPMIGERENTLSSGVKQRLPIVRAMLKDLGIRIIFEKKGIKNWDGGTKWMCCCRKAIQWIFLPKSRHRTKKKSGIFELFLPQM